jgi:hypothetical protein
LFTGYFFNGKKKTHLYNIRGIEMRIITDDIEVFSFLEKADAISFDPDKNEVLWFSHETFSALFLFCANGKFKGCKLFLLEKNFLREELEKNLLPALLTLPDDPGYSFLKNKALAITENLIAGKLNEQLFFDAH